MSISKEKFVEKDLEVIYPKYVNCRIWLKPKFL